MKSGFRALLVSAFLVAMGPGALAQAEETKIRIVTQSFAPLQWQNEGAPDGFVTDYMLAVIERVQEKSSVSLESYDFLPWKQAMKAAITDPNVLFFSLSRTRDREDKFQWLGEVSPYGQYFFQLQSRERIQADSIEALKDLDIRIGVQDGSNLHTYLKGFGFSSQGNLVLLEDYRKGTDLLFQGEIDLLPLTGFLAQASVCKQGYDGSQLAKVLFVEDLARPLWAVFSQKTDPMLVEAFKKEMVALKQNGFWETKINEHLTNWEKLTCGK